jgi:peptidase E
MKMYAIDAIYVPKLEDGWESGGQGLPTFYINPHVRGVLSEAAAERVARAILAPLLKEGDVINIHATEVELSE